MSTMQLGTITTIFCSYLIDTSASMVKALLKGVKLMNEQMKRVNHYFF